jgi:diadenosine tetraphosphate (Ap4A) HIT family hydrolase
VWIETPHAVAFPDGAPMADGHTVVAPRKHVSTIYELTLLEQQALWELVGEVRTRLLSGLMPVGFSIGFNDTLHDGISAEHAVVHVVPRRRGETPELRNGVEWVTEDHVAAWAK